MKITLAKYAGFCFGVKDAMDAAEALGTDVPHPIHILGHLIHNKQAVDRLAKKGIRMVPHEELDTITKGTVVISAHGVPDDTIAKARDKGLHVVDTTCPLVRKVHDATKKMEKEGYEILIYGDEKHTEVKGIRGNLRKSDVIHNPSEINVQFGRKKVFMVSQTTQEIEKFRELAEKLKKENPQLKVEDTICVPTKLRQKNSRELAKIVDVMIVIGGYHSANTRHLAEVCNRYTPTHHIETADRLQREWFSGKRHCGVTAGASTPDWIINSVIERLQNEFGGAMEELPLQKN